MVTGEDDLSVRGPPHHHPACCFFSFSVHPDSGVSWSGGAGHYKPSVQALCPIAVCCIDERAEELPSCRAAIHQALARHPPSGPVQVVGVCRVGDTVCQAQFGKNNSILL